VTPEPPGYIERLRVGLRRTREGLLGKVAALFQGGEAASRDWNEDLESALLQADIGPRAAGRIVVAAREAGRGAAPSWPVVREAARAVIREMLAAPGPAETAAAGKPRVVVLVGVNGGGKTTTAAKLARRHAREGRRVMLCAADTFRAGAGEQLRIWAERAGVEFAAHRPGADPSAVAFDAAASALARGLDTLIVDTAGRLHTQDPLMRELGKVVRVLGKSVPGAPHEVLLVLDATTGQNGIAQARVFHEGIGLTGLVLTKLDGTAKGGIVIRIFRELGIPIKLVATGEKPEDLAAFDPDAYVDALVGA
jgi:fused signal recognition particle receptor